MCELFPELHRDVVGHILTNRARIKGEDVESREVLDRLCDLDIVAAREHRYVRCAYRDDYDFLERHDLECDESVEVGSVDEQLYCPRCGQPIGDTRRKRHFVEYEVELNADGIERYVENTLVALEVVRTTQKVGTAAFRAEIRTGIPLKVIIPEYAELPYQSAGIFFAEPTLYVVASSLNEPVKTILEIRQYSHLADILSEPAVSLERRLELAAIPIQGRRNLSAVETKFDEMLARYVNRRWQFFEQAFIPAFVQYVTENPELSQEYLSKLKRLHQTVFGNYYVPIGGSGVTDLRGISKYEMMAELFEGQFIGDAKCYVDSTLNYDSLLSVNAHLDTDPTSPRRAVVFVAGSDISSTAWDFVIRLRDRWKYWRITIVPKYLLLELVNELDAVHLLEM